MTIASGGVIPRIHPELLVRKKGGKVVLPPAKPKISGTAAPAKSSTPLRSPAKKAKIIPTATVAPTPKGKAPAKKALKGKAAGVSLDL